MQKTTVAPLLLSVAIGAGCAVGASAGEPRHVALLAQASLASGTSSAAAIMRPGPALIVAGKVDLDRFDAAKTSILLPNGQRLAYVDMGDPRGPPVVFIHAYSDNARSWTPLLPFLAPRYRLILVDLRGHGQSAKPDCCYANIDFAYDIKLLLDALHIARADLVGHSMGSFVAQSFAEEWPDRTRRVVLISSSGGPCDCAGPAPARPDIAAIIHKLKEPLEAESPFMLAWWQSPAPKDPDFFRRQRRDAAGIPLKVWFAVLDQAWRFDDLARGLAAFKAPALLIWGSTDFILTKADRQSLIDALPTAQVTLFDGLGHNSFWDDPQRVAPVINRFLDGR